MNLHLEIITPTNIVYKDEASQVTIPTINGEITVLPNHVSLLSQIAPGVLIVKKGSQTTEMAITGGFLEILNNNISILADYAIKGEDISAVAAEEAKKRAEKAMQEKGSDRDFALAESEFRRAILELKIATKRKHHTNP